MESRVKNHLKYLFWAAVAVVLVYFCFRSIDWEQFAQAMKECRWEYVLLAMGFGLLVAFIRGLRWQMLLKPIDPATSALTCFNAYSICLAANLVFPRAGEVARLGYVVKNSSKDSSGQRRMTLDKALGTLLIERGWDILVAALTGVALLVFARERFGGFFDGLFKGLGGTRTLWMVSAGLLLLLGVFIALAGKKKDSSAFWGKTWGFLTGIGNGLTSFLKMEKGWLFLLYTLLIWFLYWLTSAAIVWALQDIEAFASLSFTDAFFIAMVGSFSTAVPVPGGFGAFHGAVGGFLKSVWGIPMGTGMIYATLNHESQVFIQALAGIASYIHESFFRKS